MGYWFCSVYENKYSDVLTWVNIVTIHWQGKVKLSEYGLYHMTDYGADVAFPIGYVFIFSHRGYMCPYFPVGNVLIFSDGACAHFAT